jgi:hypothetical protein
MNKRNDEIALKKERKKKKEKQQLSLIIELLKHLWVYFHIFLFKNAQQ